MHATPEQTKGSTTETSTTGNRPKQSFFRFRAAGARASKANAANPGGLCLCGCGAAVARRFKPGHDARFHAAQKRQERDAAYTDAMQALFA